MLTRARSSGEILVRNAWPQAAQGELDTVRLADLDGNWMGLVLLKLSSCVATSAP